MRLGTAAYFILSTITPFVTGYNNNNDKTIILQMKCLFFCFFLVLSDFRCFCRNRRREQRSRIFTFSPIYGHGDLQKKHGT